MAIDDELTSLDVSTPRLAPSFTMQRDPARQTKLIQQLYGVDSDTAAAIAEGRMKDTDVVGITDEAMGHLGRRTRAGFTPEGSESQVNTGAVLVFGQYGPRHADNLLLALKNGCDDGWCHRDDRRF